MPRFRKLPVTIEAVQFHGQMTPDVREILRRNPDNEWRIIPPGRVNDISVRDGSIVRTIDYYRIVLLTLEGEMTVDMGDWIILGVKGELYPCKPDIFAITYERIEDETE